jgi:hypothetical protein
MIKAEHAAICLLSVTLVLQLGRCSHSGGHRSKHVYHLWPLADQDIEATRLLVAENALVVSSFG